jgi:hypothetical protein
MRMGTNLTLLWLRPAAVATLVGIVTALGANPVHSFG